MIEHDEGLTLERARRQIGPRIRFTLWGYPEENHPDGSGINLEDIVAYVAQALENLKLPAYTDEHPALRTRLRRLFRPKKSESTWTEPNGYTMIDPNIAYIYSQAVFDLTGDFKKDWLEKCLNRTPGYELSQDTLTAWYVDLLEYLSHEKEPSHATTAMLRVLFHYEFSELTRVADLLEVRYLTDNDYRHRKELIVKRLNEWFGPLLEKENLPRGEVQFKALPPSAEHFVFVEKCLLTMLPLIPAHALADRLNISEADALQILRDNACRDCAHGLEREKIHAMICPKCLPGLLEALKLDGLARRLRRPDFDITGNNGIEGPPPPGRDKAFEESEQQYQELKKELGRRKVRRGSLSPDSLVIGAVNGAKKIMKLDGPTNLQLHLEPGQRFVKVEAKDEKGPLTLVMYYVPWGKNQASDKPLRFSTRVKDRGHLRFLLQYLKDDAGEPTGAVLNVEYTPPRPLGDVLGGVIGKAATGVVSVLTLAVLLKLLSRIRSRKGAGTAGPFSSTLINLLLGGLISIAVTLSLFKTPIISFVSGKNAPHTLSDANVHIAEKALAKYVSAVKDDGSEVWRIAARRPGNSNVSQPVDHSFVRNAKLTISDVGLVQKHLVEVSEDGTIRIPRLGPGAYNFIIESGGAAYTQVVRFPLGDSDSILLSQLLNKVSDTRPQVNSGATKKVSKKNSRVSSKASAKPRRSRSPEAMRQTHYAEQLILVRDREQKLSED